MKNDFSIFACPWAEVVDIINQDPNILNKAYCFIMESILAERIDQKMIELMIGFLESNNIIFYAHANYTQYQDVAKYLFENIEKFVVARHQKYRFYLVSVYSDYFLQNPNLREECEKKLLQALAYFKQSKYKEYKFLGLIHISQFYLFIGNLTLNEQYLEEAKIMLTDCSNKNHRLFFLYHYSWSFYEKGDFNTALLIVNQAIGIIIDQYSPISLNLHNVKASILYKIGQYKESINIAEDTYLKACCVFSKSNEGVLAETLLTIAKGYNASGEYKLALIKAKESIKLLKILFGGDDIDVSQAASLVVLGDSFIGTKDIKSGHECYKKALNLYQKIYKTNLYNMPEAMRVVKYFKGEHHFPLSK